MKLIDYAGWFSTMLELAELPIESHAEKKALRGLYPRFAGRLRGERDVRRWAHIVFYSMLAGFACFVGLGILLDRGIEDYPDFAPPVLLSLMFLFPALYGFASLMKCRAVYRCLRRDAERLKRRAEFLPRERLEALIDLFDLPYEVWEESEPNASCGCVDCLKIFSYIPDSDGFWNIYEAVCPNCGSEYIAYGIPERPLILQDLQALHDLFDEENEYV